ncbi:MAG: TetR family transcriptional regulator [Gemmatimonadetes bacterium]|nr:TetR family transcriptional regulator [Gemmatimonadota bacterium]
MEREGTAPTMPELTDKGLRTRARIVEAAVGLVTEVGYERASMRAIAERAGVSVGNAYYYFPSKAHLVRAFYDRTGRELAAAAAPILARERTLEARLRGVLWSWFKLIDRYHGTATALFAAAADPKSPLNPFGRESTPAREEAIALYREVVEGGSSHIPDDLRADLPVLLWTAHMGVTLFWIHDPSPGRARTAALIDRAPSLLVRVIALSRIPGMGDLRRQVQDLIAGMTAPVEGAAHAFIE